MKKLRILRRIMKSTGADKIWLGFVIFFLICTTVIWLRESGIQTWGDAFWYCYAVVTTIGFGDVLVHTHLARVLSVLLSVYAVVVIAIITGVIVNFYNQLVSLKQKGSLSQMLEKLERLPELSKEELEAISEKVKKL